MTPRPDPPIGRPRLRVPLDVRDALQRALARRGRRRGSGRPEAPGGEPCPVVPDRPLDL